MGDFVVGVDVGTGSARAALFDRSGKMVSRSEKLIAMHQPEPDFAEQDSEDIWRAVCFCVQDVIAQADVAPDQITGISFDAACSLVFLGPDQEQVSISKGGEDSWNTIVWLDHRAINEAEECTASGHKVLDYIGGVMSPEMQTPKLMWVKRNLPDAWQRAAYFFDLADFLTFKASGSLARSQCTLTCKWTYLSHQEQGWSDDFFAAMGLEDMLGKGQVPDHSSPIGENLGGLSPEAATELGLTTDCQVGVGLIDAHAGALGLIGPLAGDLEAVDHHLAVIAGTSTCVMALANHQRAVPGVWGPYFGAVVPGLWLNEGGQSATGALLDHIIRLHGAGGEPSGEMHGKITRRISELRSEQGQEFAQRLHVLPDFHGNRSPLADPHALGVISGLNLDSSFDSLCALYWRTAVGIALGLRHILEALDAKGYHIDTLHVAGGHTKNPILMELYADATGCNVVDSKAEDAVLLGAGMVAARAGGIYASISDACSEMGQGGTTCEPNPSFKAGYDRDYKILLEMMKHRQVLDNI